MCHHVATGSVGTLTKQQQWNHFCSILFTFLSKKANGTLRFSPPECMYNVCSPAEPGDLRKPSKSNVILGVLLHALSPEGGPASFLWEAVSLFRVSEIRSKLQLTHSCMGLTRMQHTAKIRLHLRPLRNVKASVASSNEQLINAKQPRISRSVHAGVQTQLSNNNGFPNDFGRIKTLFAQKMQGGYEVRCKQRGKYVSFALQAIKKKRHAGHVGSGSTALLQAG